MENNCTYQKKFPYLSRLLGKKRIPRGIKIYDRWQFNFSVSLFWLNLSIPLVERRDLKKAMKTVLFSTATATAMEEGERSEARDRCYYPGCRKDANCNCKICLDSINATLDLMSYSVQKTSLMKLSASRPNVEATPISFNPLILTTPPSGTSRIMKYPNFISPVKLSLGFEAEEEERDSSSLHRFLTLVFVLSLIFVMTIGFSCAIARVIRPKLSVFVHDLNGKLWEVQGIVNLEISNGSCKDSMWEIDQVDLETLLLQLIIVSLLGLFSVVFLTLCFQCRRECS